MMYLVSHALDKRKPYNNNRRVRSLGRSIEKSDFSQQDWRSCGWNLDGYAVLIKQPYQPSQRSGKNPSAAPGSGHLPVAAQLSS
jgi:hypothetical protein